MHVGILKTFFYGYFYEQDKDATIALKINGEVAERCSKGDMYGSLVTLACSFNVLVYLDLLSGHNVKQCSGFILSCMKGTQCTAAIVVQ